MDWYLDHPDQVGELRHELVGYLSRHAVADSGGDIEDSELVVSEAVGNAMRHTSGPVWVSLAWASEHPTLTVYDVGPGFDPAEVRVAGSEPGLPVAAAAGAHDSDIDPHELIEDSGRGLLIMSALAPRLSASLRDAAGTVLTLTLPARRAPSASFDPPRRHAGVLPSMAEADPGGGFGKEAFLRALVVQLSQAVEARHGPEAAEAAVAQVGTDVGGQMEEEFRLATEAVGRLSPEQLGECYVRLKHAIDGEFTVVEATPDRIVLENRQCPFGEAVHRAPALCRMTSSVFGGLAARNSPEGASVLLEERIAVGDAGCRVVVYLGPPPPDVAPFAHRYRPPA